ncbi:unnamed protein product [Hermetia illucens]|uniref:Proteasome activator complex subunit 4 n=1 Tax=Hermetia illucens TaxID=343691 RepID=A0A7R8Z3D8_HERIL|nr:proteasome activator complex subunit 4B-like isoform X2 [Hermetia illucens]CAD7093813.1 unnamed protein product [Hermetia illucens]
MSDFEDDVEDAAGADTGSRRDQDRYEKLGFRPQKELPWNRYLPYADKVDAESQRLLARIKADLAKALAMRDISPGVGYCANRLQIYIKLYGLKFSKEDHIYFIKVFVELISLPFLEPAKVNKFCVLLSQLFRKPYYLSPDDLQIEWRPLYELFIIYLHRTSSKGNFYQFFASLQSSLKSVIQSCSVHFPKSATQEILDEVLPKLQPLDTGKPCQVFEICHYFLNMYQGYELWFDDFMNLWNTYHNPPWSEDMMNIMGNLAFENIGKIDWEPYLPVMFARILRWIDLPVSYKHLKVSRNQNMNAVSVAKWIVAVIGPKTSGQKYLTNFIGTIESYLHPANLGKWIKVLGQLLVGLPEYFSKRLEFERFRKCDWMDPVPDQYKLTEECITAFVESLKPAAFQTMYSRVDGSDVYKIFKYLSNLRPELIIPGVIERVYANLEAVTEPHRLTASLQCLVGISRALICGQNGYTAGRTHVIPVLYAVLPGIDPNDLRKALLTMNFYGAFVFQIPLIDCSKASQYHELTEEESLICEQTADLEDFVMQFFDQLFIMIKFSTQESIRMEQSNTDSNKSKYDMIVENSISSGLQVILGQSSESILISAAKKINDFVQSNLLEPHVAAPLLGTLVTSVGVVAGPHIFKTLVPYLTDRLNTYIKEHEDVAEIEKQSDDFLYYFTIFYYLFKSDPREAVKYLDDCLLPIIDATSKFKCKLTAKIVNNLILNTLYKLSAFQIFDIKSIDYSIPLSEQLPVRHWGKRMGYKDKLDWFVPGEKERAASEKIIHRYLPEILETFEKYIRDEITLDREEILKKCNIVLSLLSFSYFLPNWDGTQLTVSDTIVDEKPLEIMLGFENLEIKMPDGGNIRLAVIDTIGRLQEKILATSDDDIQSLKAIISIWERVHMRKAYINSFDSEIKSYRHLKQFQEFRLVKHKRNMKGVVAKRVMIQQTCRDEMSPPPFTDTHRRIFKYLIKLATSHYSAVRTLAQIKLFHIMVPYTFSHREILDEIVHYLKLDSNENHEAFKGGLYMLLSGRTKLVVRHDWLCVEKLWLNLLKSTPSEKPSIVHLLDAIIYSISEEFITLTIDLDISDKIVDYGLKLAKLNGVTITDEDIERGKQLASRRNTENIDRYNRIIETIINIAQNNSLHWRYHLMASTMVHILVHPKQKFPLCVAKYFVPNLVHDSIKERKTTMRIVNSMLAQQKRKHVKMKVDPFEIAGVPKPEGKLQFGNRPDNQWLQYNKDTLPKCQADWDQPRYLHKAEGFFGWSSDFWVYAPSDQQPKLDRTRDEMNEIEKVFYDFFSNKDLVDKFISLWSLEEQKGGEKFKQSRFSLMKHLFRSFGDMFYSNFHPHLERLIKENKLESNHRCAAEFLSGIMRGMKHWPYDKTEAMFAKITPLIRLALDNITVETDDFWGTCFATASEHIDPRRQYWLHEVLMEDPLRESTSFVDCCRIFCLQGPFNQHVWRMDSYAHRLLEYLKPFLNHPFQNVRIRLGSILINIFEADLQFKGGNTPKCPRVSDMIKEVVKKIEPLYYDMPSTICMVEGATERSDVTTQEQKKYEEAVRLYKTISQWIIGVISRNTNGNEIPYFDLLPFACRLESCEQDSELADTSTTLLAMIAQALTLPDRMEYALNKINDISKSSSWGARLAVIDALQVVVFHNMAIILSKPEWIEYVQDIVLRLLEDTSLEVREKAAQVLGGLLHCSFLPATDKLLERFKTKCKTKVVRTTLSRRSLACGPSEPVRNGRSGLDSVEADAIRVRHTGVLGLCAFISAYPYDVPDFVPDVFEYLGAHLNDPQPIPSTIRKTVGDFKRTHHDNWAMHQLKFTEDQLAVLSDLTIPPSYYS